MKKKTVTVPVPSKGSTAIIIFILLLGSAFLIGRFSGQVELLKKGQGTTAPSAQVKSGTAQQQPPAGNQIQQPGAGATVAVSIDDDPIMGDKNAPVTMIEFSDYECPFCKRFWSDTLGQIKTNYIDTGKVKFVYRDLPLPFHEPMATKEAIASNCAREQGGDKKFFEYHDEIFTRTTSNGNGLNDDKLQSIAQDLGLNMSKFNSCIEDDAQKEEVKKDIADAQAVGATGTPTLLIGKSTKDGNIQGERIIGAQPYSVFQPVIEKYLN